MVWSDFGLSSVVVMINSVVCFQTKSEEQMSEEQKAAEKAKPVSSTPVPGTPWCVVWTGDGRIFFYNPSQRLSVWDRPSDLKFRQDVDRMVQAPPNIPGTSCKLCRDVTFTPLKKCDGSTQSADVF